MRRGACPAVGHGWSSSADDYPPCVSLPLRASERLVHPQFSAPRASISRRRIGGAGEPALARHEDLGGPRKVMAEFEELGLLNAAPARWSTRRGGLLPPAT